MYWKWKEKEKSFLINSGALHNPRLFVILQGTSLLIWGMLRQTSDAYLSIKIGSCDEQWFNYMTITVNNAWRIPKICRARVAVINASGWHWLSVKSSIVGDGGRRHIYFFPSRRAATCCAVWKTLSRGLTTHRRWGRNNGSWSKQRLAHKAVELTMQLFCMWEDALFPPCISTKKWRGEIFALLWERVPYVAQE